MTMTTRVARSPAISASTPTMSRMIGARMIASTNVGRTRKKSVTRMRLESVSPPTKPDTMPMTTPTRTVMTVASRPMIIETRAPWTVRFSMSRPSSSVPRMCSTLGGSKPVPEAVRTVSSGPTNSCGAMARTVKKTRIPSPRTPSRRRRNFFQNSRKPRARSAQTPVGALAVAAVVMSAPAGRARRTADPHPGWPGRPRSTGSGTRPGGPGSHARRARRR